MVFYRLAVNMFINFAQLVAVLVLGLSVGACFLGAIGAAAEVLDERNRHNRSRHIYVGIKYFIVACAAVTLLKFMVVGF